MISDNNFCRPAKEVDAAQQVIPFFVYSPQIRKVIYTTNVIESIQSLLRRVTRKRGAFPTPESVKKVLYLAIDRISKRWNRLEVKNHHLTANGKDGGDIKPGDKVVLDAEGRLWVNNAER